MSARKNTKTQPATATPRKKTGSKRGKGKTKKRKKDQELADEEEEESLHESFSENETLLENEENKDQSDDVFEDHENSSTLFLTPPHRALQETIKSSTLSQSFIGKLFQEHQAATEPELWLNDALPLPAPSLRPQESSEVEALTNQLFSTLDALKGLGYDLQPMIHGEWHSTAVSDWRSVPSSWLLPSPFSSSSLRNPASASASKRSNTLNTPLLTSSPDLHEYLNSGFSSRGLTPSTEIGRTYSSHKRTGSEIEQAARDLCLLTGTPAGPSSC
jgi:hypothetical protein